jgi:hypothetical protein
MGWRYGHVWQKKRWFCDCKGEPEGGEQQQNMIMLIGGNAQRGRRQHKTGRPDGRSTHIGRVNQQHVAAVRTEKHYDREFKKKAGDFS